MKFWDASAIVPLLIEESTTPLLQTLYRRDPSLLVWWGTEIEAASAVARLERMGLPARLGSQALLRLEVLAQRWQEVLPVPPIRERARVLLRTHALRAGDAWQLAAFALASESQPDGVAMVCLDVRLVAAGRAEGLAVIDRSALEAGDRAPDLQP